jgi:hypothetical protein
VCLQELFHVRSRHVEKNLGANPTIVSCSAVKFYNATSTRLHTKNILFSLETRSM